VGTKEGVAVEVQPRVAEDVELLKMLGEMVAIQGDQVLQP